MDLSLLVVNIVAGALVGYITKTLAINMLFKRYPIIGGAEIIKDRENLEVAMSLLVEEKLIKPSTMLEEFQKDEFKVSFENLVDHIVENTINENIKELDSISQVKGFDETSKNLHNFLINNREKILNPGLEVLFDNVLIDDILSNEQIKNLVDKLLIIFSISLINDSEKILKDFLNEIGEKKLSDFVSSELLKKIVENLPLENLELLVSSNFSTIDKCIDEIYNSLSLDKIIDDLEKSLKQKTFIQLIGENENSDIASLINRIKFFITSEKGQIIVNEFLGHLIDTLKIVDIPLSSLITEEIEIKVLQFVEKHLPDLLVTVEEWLAQNKLEMESLIHISIEGHLESENLIKQVIGSIFAQNLADRYKIVESTLEEIKDMAKKSGPSIIGIVNRFLDNTKISDIANYLDKNFIDKTALTEVIIELISTYLPRLNLKIFDTFLNKKLTDISLINEISFKKVFKDNLYSLLKEQLKELVSKPEVINSLTNFAKDRISDLSERKLNQIIPDSSNFDYKRIIFDFVNAESSKDFISDKISQELPSLLKDKTINQIVNNEIKTDIYVKLAELYNLKIDNVLQILKKEKIKNLYNKTAQIYADLCKNKFFSKHLTDTLIDLAVKLIRDNKLFDGKIYVSVKESFTKFSDEELKQEMDSFMGKELQPIKLLGAFLGAVVGIIMYYVSFIPGYGKYATGYWALLSYPLSYALTEVGTNWMAIKMLFRPYEQKRFLNIPMPFTPGIFAKNKKALADSMVNFIDKKLLSKDNMVRILEKYQHKWKEVIKDVVSKNDYQVIDETLNKYAKDNYETISPIVLELGFNEVNKNKEEISGYLVEEVKNIDLNTVNLNSIKKQVSLKIDQSKASVQNAIKNTIFAYNFDLEVNINQLIGKEKISSLNSLLRSVFENSLQTLSFSLSDKKQFDEFLDSFSPSVNNILDKKIEEIVSYSSIDEVKEKFILFLENNVKSEDLQNKAFDYIEQKFYYEGLSSQKSFNELFDGKLMKTVLKESDVIIDAFSNYLLTLAKNKKEELAKIILSDIEKKGLVETMLVRFGGVKNDVRGIIDVLVDHKLQPYLEDKKAELKVLFKSYVEINVSKIKLGDLGLTESVFDKNNIRNLIKNIINNDKTLTILNKIIGSTIDDLIQNLSLKEILTNIDMGSFSSIKGKFGDEIELVRNKLSDSLYDNKSLVVNSSYPIVEIAVENMVYSAKLSNLLKDISKEEVIKTINNTTDIVYSMASFKNVKLNMINHGFEQISNNLSDILDYSVLKRDLENMIRNLTVKSYEKDSRSLKFQNDIRVSVKDITINFVEVINENVENDTKKVVENILVDSLVDSLRINNREVLEPINFDAIVRKEVEKMSPARIEAMFDFAKPVFRLLIWYGALGGIIGLFVGIFEAFR